MHTTVEIANLSGCRAGAVGLCPMAAAAGRLFVPLVERCMPESSIHPAPLRSLAAGHGAFALDDKMVDMPIIKAAERVLTRARAAGKID